MKSPHTPAPEKTTKERGIALITVLSILMLMAVLIMAFFSISQNELTASTSYSQGQQAQQLTQTATNMVIHQLRAATEKVEVAWASQPGLIRTWTESGFNAAYKLYSDEDMVEGSLGDVRDDESDLRNWNIEKNKNTYVDLNEPVIRGEEVYYPIVDPRAYPRGAASQRVSKSSWEPQNWRDGFEEDPEKRHVEGFYFATDQVERATNTTVDGHVVGLPMPVKWIYQLEDGTMGTLVNDKFEPLKVNGNEAGEGKPSASNPIVSRIAFWTDDETAKININTAAGGRPWDVPRAGGLADRNYGLTQPVRNEFQRYPSHPAVTSLAPVLFPNGPRFTNDPALIRQLSLQNELIYRITPRVIGGQNTSMSGVREIRASESTIDMPIPDRHRLYATFDELLFMGSDKSDPSSMTLPRTMNRFPWAENDPKGMVSYLNRLRFFLTANSRAPETTVFNTPRISMWPSFHEDPALDDPAPGGKEGTLHFTEFDKRIRFCAEVGRSESRDSVASARARYHIMRERSDSSDHDILNIARNQELYKHFAWLTSQNIPGVGVSYAAKYPNDRYQIMTQIFDYIRCTNLFDDNLVDPVTQDRSGYTVWGDNPDDHRAFTNNRLLVNNSNMTDGDDNRKLQPGHGQVAPLRINPTNPDQPAPVIDSVSEADSLNTDTFSQGFGRFYALNEVGLHFICSAEGTSQLGGRRIPMMVEHGWNINAENIGRKGFKSSHQYFWYGNVCPLEDQDIDTDLSSAQPGDKTKVAEVYSDYIPSDYFTNFTPDQRQQREDDWKMLTSKWNWNYMIPIEEPLRSDEKIIQPALIMQMHSPAKGWTGIKPDFRLEVKLNPSDFKIKGSSIPADPANPAARIHDGQLFPHLQDRFYEIKSPDANSTHHYWGSSTNGGVYTARALFSSQSDEGARRARYATYHANDDNNYDYGERPGNLCFPLPDKWLTDRGAQRGEEDSPEDKIGDEAAEAYPFIGGPIRVKKTGLNNKGLEVEAGLVEIRLFLDDGFNSDSKKDVDRPVQVAFVDMEDMDSVAIPNLHPGLAGGFGRNQKPIIQHTRQGRDFWSFHRTGAFRDDDDATPDPLGLHFPRDPKPVRVLWPDDNTGKGRLAFLLDRTQGGTLIHEVFRLPAIDDNGDPISGNRGQSRSYAYHVDVTRSYVISHGDARLSAVRPVLTTDNDIDTRPQEISGHIDDIETFTGYVKHPLYAAEVEHRTNQDTRHSYWVHEYRDDKGQQQTVTANVGSDFAGFGGGNKALSVYIAPNGKEKAHATSYAPDTYRLRFNPYGDWDNGTATQADGCWINKPDEGNSFGIRQDLELTPYEKEYGAVSRKQVPYFSRPNQHEPSRPGLFSPNRITTGPVMFGSLPTGVYGERNGSDYQSQPWQTLLFRKQQDVDNMNLFNEGEHFIESRKIHPGNESPADHFLLDFFWMPIVEPWSISEPLSTAGKINVNYEIAPFGHIKRASGLHGVFASEEMLTIPNDPYAGSSKRGSGWGKGYNWWEDKGGDLRFKSLRSWINTDQTLKQFEDRFAADDHFISASEFTQSYLVPEGMDGLILKFGTLGRMDDLWNPKMTDGISMVGDNSREKPYGNIYPRLTTKSNTFQVHFRTQILKQSIMSPRNPGQRRTTAEWATFDEATDNVVSEYRGSTILERYVDPNDTRIPDYAVNLQEGDDPSAVNGIDYYYRFRVVSHRRFAP